MQLTSKYDVQYTVDKAALHPTTRPVARGENEYDDLAVKWSMYRRKLLLGC